MKIKILSWNIWIHGDFVKISSFLKETNADIIGLQEVKDDDSKRDVIGYLRSLGYEYVFAPVKHIWKEKIYNDGPAIFSKYPIKNNKKYILSEEDRRGAARADIQINGKQLHVFNTHLIHTHQQQSKIQDEQAENLVKLVPQEKSILMGDFNALPDSNAVKIVGKDFINTDPNLLPTWSIYPEGCIDCNPKGVNYKLDYIFTSKDLKTKDYKVEESKASDHLPISVLVEL